MDVSTAKLYDVLIEKGFEKAKVQEALAEVVTHKELTERHDSLEERIDRRFSQFEAKMYRAMLVQTGAIAAIVLGLIQFAV